MERKLSGKELEAWERKMTKKDKHALEYNTRRFLGKLYVLSRKGMTKEEAKRTKRGHKKVGEKVRTTKEGRTYSVWYY